MATNPEEVLMQAMFDLQVRNLERLFDSFSESPKMNKNKFKKVQKFIDQIDWENENLMDVYLSAWKFGKELDLI